MGARTYVPEIGAFLQPDPVPGGSANSYGYADGDPVNNTDLSGDWVDSYYGATSAPGWVGPSLATLQPPVTGTPEGGAAGATDPTFRLSVPQAENVLIGLLGGAAGSAELPIVGDLTALGLSGIAEQLSYAIDQANDQNKALLKAHPGNHKLWGVVISFGLHWVHVWFVPVLVPYFNITWDRGYWAYNYNYAQKVINEVKSG